MNRLWQRIKTDWEISLCVLAAVAVGTSLVIGWLRLNGGEEEQATRQHAKRQASLLGPSPYAFRQDLQEPAEELPSPFIFEGLTKAPKKPKHAPRNPRVKVKPPRHAPVAAVPKPLPVVVPPEPVAPEPPATVKRRVYGVRLVTYLFSAQGALGKPVATIQLRNPANGKTAAPAMVPVGGRIDGIRVISFNETALTIMDASGRRHRVPFGETGKAYSTPRIVEVPR